jgi:hypothetical protein
MRRHRSDDSASMAGEEPSCSPRAGATSRPARAFAADEGLRRERVERVVAYSGGSATPGRPVR